MKLHFEPNLDFQLQAIDAVCNLFRGQEVYRTGFTVMREPSEFQAPFAFAENDLGVGNRLLLSQDNILENLNAVQLRSDLSHSSSLNSMDFTVEMETGTGKTYVYLRTILELNKRYGFTKFVVVVPSIAIKEGVYKTLQITEEHFRTLYSGTPYEYFLYDSAKLGQVRNFATSSQIQIMVVTVGAINKANVNNLYRENEKSGGERPIDLIKATKPVLIVDEPQSVDGGLQGRGKRALETMNPICTLRYSATHADKHHMVYRLDALDAYERKLVKQIEVASATVEDAHNKPYVRLVSTSNRHGTISARVELDIMTTNGVTRCEKTVLDGEELAQTTGRAVYHDCSIGEIRTEKGNEFLELRVPGGECFLRRGEAYGDVDLLTVQRKMINRTIREHLDKEKRLHPQGIKVLSLFFIDKVERYRRYDEDGKPVKGDYARLFEEEYQRFAHHPDYQSYFENLDFDEDIESLHGGYFSIDRKRVGDEMVEVFKDTGGKSQADEDTYNLIMRDKEKLLSLETPLKFIFSHSALREGWDNPNVFQICALREIRTEHERRQTIGRGLRLCVNQRGERLHGFDVNTLTVIALENYEEFAENLQKEIEKDTGIRFGVVEAHHFATLSVASDDGKTTDLGIEASKELWKELKAEGFIDVGGKIQDSLRKALKDGSFTVPENFEAQYAEIAKVLRKVAGRLEIKDADERCIVRPRQAILHGAEFMALWDRIKHKTTYRVSFDNEGLLTKCMKALRDAPDIPTARLQWRKADIAIGQSGVEATETVGARTEMLYEDEVELPDILTELQDRTQLTRRSIQRILCGSDRLGDFRRNPQKFIELAAQTINHCKRQALVEGIKYQRIGDESYYAQELYEQEELTGYLKNMLVAKKSVYEQVIFESGIEARFADQLEKNIAVKVYAKLPGWFTVPTPLGSYNPDWAVLIDSDEGERLYLVVETKGSLFDSDIRGTENAKIECGKAHFDALKMGESPAQYKVATSVDDILAAASAG